MIREYKMGYQRLENGIPSATPPVVSLLLLFGTGIRRYLGILEGISR